jgi:RNA recognition motif-containing protein
MELAAQIANQQSIYSSENRAAGKRQEESRNADSRSKRPNGQSQPSTKHKTVLRTGGGKVWEDPTLLEWDPSHFRLYVGNLGGEVTDEVLKRAFGAYDSLQKARVVRDKRTTKSKGFGFVSFKEPDDMLNAWRDLNGQYIGSHPVKLTKANAEVKATVVDRETLKKQQAESPYAQNLVKHGRVEKKKKPTGPFVPRTVKRS